MNGYTGIGAQVDQAANKWSARTIFTITQGSATSAPVKVTVDAYTADWIGLGIPGPDPFSGTYTYGSVKLSAEWMNNRHWNCNVPDGANCELPPDSDNQKEGVASHELGHVMGLAHTGESPSYEAIMNPSHKRRIHTWDLVGAQNHDVNDVAALY